MDEPGALLAGKQRSAHAAKPRRDAHLARKQPRARIALLFQARLQHPPVAGAPAGKGAVAFKPGLARPAVMTRLERRSCQPALCEQHRPHPLAVDALAAKLVRAALQRGKGVCSRHMRGKCGRIGEEPEPVLHLPVDAGNRRVLGSRGRKRNQRQYQYCSNVDERAFHAPPMTGKLWRADGGGRVSPCLRAPPAPPRPRPVCASRIRRAPPCSRNSPSARSARACRCSTCRPRQ